MQLQCRNVIRLLQTHTQLRESLAQVAHEIAPAIRISGLKLAHVEDNQPQNNIRVCSEEILELNIELQATQRYYNHAPRYRLPRNAARTEKGDRATLVGHLKLYEAGVIPQSG